MIVYVETNFVLELAYQQEEHQQAEEIASLAEAGSILLILPAFCGGEPYERMIRRARDRKQLHDLLASEFREMSRSSPYKDLNDRDRELNAILSQSASDEKARLDDVLLRLTQISSMIPLDNDVLRVSFGYQRQLALKPQDAIVFSSIIRHLRAQGSEQKKLFITKNRKDFSEPDIRDLLSFYGCKLLYKFSDAAAYIRSIINQDRQ